MHCHHWGVGRNCCPRYIVVAIHLGIVSNHNVMNMTIHIVRTTSLIHIQCPISDPLCTSNEPRFCPPPCVQGDKVDSVKSTLHLISSRSTSSLEDNHPDLNPPQNPRPNPPVLAARLFALSSNPNPATFRTSSTTLRISSPSTTPSLFLSSISSTCFCNFS